MKFSIKDFFSKCSQMRSFLRIWSHLLKKSLTEDFIFCAALYYPNTYCLNYLRARETIASSEVHPEPCQTSKIEFFSKIDTWFKFTFRKIFHWFSKNFFPLNLTCKKDTNFPELCEKV